MSLYHSKQMRFAHPELLLLFLLLPLLIYLHGNKRFLPAITVPSLGFATTLANRSGKLWPSLLILRLMTMTLLLLALARPQLGTLVSVITPSQIDIMMVIDISRSTNIAELISGNRPLDRLASIKSSAATFIGNRPNDRIGLIVFSGQPCSISPLTLEHHWLLDQLEAITIGMIEPEGAAIGHAIGAATAHLDRQPSQSRSIVLITNGFNPSGTVSPVTTVEAARALGIKLYTINTLPDYSPTTDNSRTDPPHTQEAADEQSDDSELLRLTLSTGGRYFQAADKASLLKAMAEINKAVPTSEKTKRFSVSRDLFPLLVGMALVLMICERLTRCRCVP